MAKGKKSLSVRNREVQVELDALERKLKGWGEVGMWLPEKERQRYLRWIDGLREELARAVIEKDEKRFSYLVRHDFSALRKELKAKEKEIKRMVKKLRWLLKDIDKRPDAYLGLAGVYSSGRLVVPTAKMKLVLRMKGIPYEWWEVPAFKNDVAGKLRDWYRHRRTLIKEVAAKHKARSERARSMDARRKAKKVIDLRKATIKELERYLKNPNKYDVKGLDTPQPKKEKKKAKKEKKPTKKELMEKARKLRESYERRGFDVRHTQWLKNADEVLRALGRREWIPEILKPLKLPKPVADRMVYLAVYEALKPKATKAKVKKAVLKAVEKELS